MQPFNFYFPTQVMMGPGRIKELGACCKRFSEKAFIVYDPFLKNGALVESIRKDLKASGVSYVEFYDVVPNPRNTTIDAGTEICVKEKCGVVVVVGGGSAIDTAKAIALTAVHGGKCWDYTERQNEEVKRPASKGLPVIVSPTTAGTGSEATCGAVINNLEQKRKCTIINPVLYPDISIIDPELMLTLPSEITALTGLDTFAHAFEAYISKNANPASELLSIASMQYFASSIRQAVNNGGDIEARSAMAMSCALGGLAIFHAGVVLPHALGQPLSAFTDAPHGGTLVACIPQVIEWTIPYAQEKFAKVAEILGPDAVSGMDEAGKAAALPGIMHRLYDDLHIDVSFSKYGLREEDIESMVDLCYTGFKQDIDGHPRPVTREDVVMLVKRCM